MRRGVEGLPAVVAGRQVWSLEPALVPHVEVPHRVAVEALQRDQVDVVVLVDRHAGVGVVRRREVGDAARGNAHRSAH